MLVERDGWSSGLGTDGGEFRQTSRNRDWSEEPTGTDWSELQLRLIPRGEDGVGRGRGADKFRVCSAHLPAAAVTENGGGGGSR